MLRVGEAETKSIINTETRIDFWVNIADERRWPREEGSAEHFSLLYSGCCGLDEPFTWNSFQSNASDYGPSRDHDGEMGRQ